MVAPRHRAPGLGFPHVCERMSSHPDVSPSLGLRGASARPAANHILSAQRPGQAESFPEASQARVHRPGMDTHDSGCTGPSKTGVRGLGFSGILTTSSHLQLGPGAQLPPHPL